MRKTAALAGLSHQQVSRILHKASQGLSTDYYEKSPYIRAAVDVAFDIHKDLARGVAKRQEIPFSEAVPVYSERMALRNHALESDGKRIFKGTLDEIDKYMRDNDPPGDLRIKRLLGDRVVANHTHWLSNKLRGEYIKKQQRTKKFHNVSVASVVDLPAYMKAATKRIKAFIADKGEQSLAAIEAREQLKKLQRAGENLARIYTPYTSMNPEHPPAAVVAGVAMKIKDRHEPAMTGARGTLLADQILLQLDTRKSKDAKPAKTRRTPRAGK